MSRVTSTTPRTSPAFAELLRARVLAALYSGDVTSGERLPSVRDVAERFAVSRRAVAGAYRQLAEDGLLVVSARSGAYVPDGAPNGGEPGMPERIAPRCASTDRASDRSWMLDAFAHALDHGVAATRVPSLLAGALDARHLRVAVLERLEDHRWALCDELRRDFQLDATPVDVDALGAGGGVCRDELPPAVRDADLLLSTPFFGARVRRLASLLGKPVCITTPGVALYAGIRRTLACEPVHVVCADHRFGERLDAILSGPASLDAALSSAACARAPHPVATYACEDIERLPAYGAVYLTRLARYRLRSRVAAQPVFARSHPELRVLSRETAHALLRFVLGPTWPAR